MTSYVCAATDLGEGLALRIIRSGFGIPDRGLVRVVAVASCLSRRLSLRAIHAALLAGTALVGGAVSTSMLGTAATSSVIMVSLLGGSAARADGGTGGNSGTGQAGGSGGTAGAPAGSAGAGARGSDMAEFSGAGGGGGFSGGFSGGPGGAAYFGAFYGGLPGIVPGYRGQDGSDHSVGNNGTGTGGGGGAGGNNGNGAGAAAISNTGALTGQTGGRGGNGGVGSLNYSGSGGGGGGGGAGGHGAVITGSGASSNGGAGVITGGIGGIGGSGGVSYYASSGGNGASAGGGAGVWVKSSGAGATFTNAGTVSGGAGGLGPAAGNYAVSGPGGLGGAGVQFDGNGTLANAGTITGGTGGRGGASGGNNGNASGSAGGAGVSMLAGGTLINSGTIRGGVGGEAGASPGSGAGGVGAAAIVGANLTIINSGIIIGAFGGSGGVGGNGSIRAAPISFTGGSNVLELQSGSSITGNVVAFSSADTLRLGGTGNATFDLSQIGAAAQYRGFGHFAKTGSGTWTVTNTPVTATAWQINAGTLNVLGNLSGSNGITANSGGTLTGTGSVGNTAIAGGVFAPDSGTAGSSMTVNGTLGFTAGSTYAVAIDPTTSSFVQVSGTATLGGATVSASYANGAYLAKRYSILTAGSVSGSFGTLVNTNLSPNVQAALSYDATHAYLNLTLSFVPDPNPPPIPGLVIPGGLNGNARNVGDALTHFFNTSGGIPMVYSTLTPAGLAQAAGETAAGSQQTSFVATTQFFGTLFDHGSGDAAATGAAATSFADGSSGNAYAAPTASRSGTARDAFAMLTKAPAPDAAQRWSVWASGFGGSQTTDGNAMAGSSKTGSSIVGTAVGVDYRLSPFTTAGFALAGGGTSFSVAGSGSGRSDLFQAGGFIRHTVGPAYLAGALAYGWQDVTTNRTVSIAGLDQLQARFNANTYSGRAEAGYRVATPWLGLTPYAAGQVTAFDLPAYAERVRAGAATFALSYGARTISDSRSELGLRTDRSHALAGAILTLRGRFAWAHDFNPDRGVAATFQALPGASFAAHGAAQARDSALTTAAAELTWRGGWSVATTFEGEFSKVTRSYAGKGAVRYAW